MPGSRVNPALLAAIIRFNAPGVCDFAPEALPAPAEALLRNGALRRLESTRAGRTLVSAWLRRQLGVMGVFTDFQEETRRLALLDRKTLSSLALIYGACVYAQEAARMVRREDTMALRASLGSYYDYALSRGRFQMQRAREFFAAFRREDPLPGRMAAAGFTALCHCLASWPEPLARLAAPRLPAELRSSLAEPGGGARGEGFWAPDHAVTPDFFWTDLKKLLLSEVAPQWQACFA